MIWQKVIFELFFVSGFAPWHNVSVTSGNDNASWVGKKSHVRIFSFKNENSPLINSGSRGVSSVLLYTVDLFPISTGADSTKIGTWRMQILRTWKSKFTLKWYTEMIWGQMRQQVLLNTTLTLFTPAYLSCSSNQGGPPPIYLRVCCGSGLGLKFGWQDPPLPLKKMIDFIIFFSVLEKAGGRKYLTDMLFFCINQK